MVDKEIIAIELTEESIESMVYEIRGQKVMLDFDLARIYGYATKRFNEQVKNNIEKFPKDFMFQLTREETEQLVMPQIATSRNCEIESEKISRSIFSTTIISETESKQISRCQIGTTMQTKGIRGGRVYLPYAFTEQGIYMLMTVLKGELAVKQSKALIRLFKKMKDYIVESNNLLTTRDIIELSNQVHKNTKNIETIKRNNAVINKKLTEVMDNFIDVSTYRQFLILAGEKIDAKLAYKQVYSFANKSIVIVDDYISLKTLSLLKICSSCIQVSIITDNLAKDKLNEQDLEDFEKETGIEVTIKPSKGLFHDRYILIDYDTKNEMLFDSGPSSKDAGNRIGTITRIEKTEEYKRIIKELLM